MDLQFTNDDDTRQLVVGVKHLEIIDNDSAVPLREKLVLLQAQVNALQAQTLTLAAALAEALAL